MKISKKEALEIIKEIKRLEKAKGEEFRKPKLKILRVKLLENMMKDTERAGNYILNRNYQFGNISLPYLQIFTKRTWKIHEDYKENFCPKES